MKTEKWDLVSHRDNGISGHWVFTAGPEGSPNDPDNDEEEDACPQPVDVLRMPKENLPE